MSLFVIDFTGVLSTADDTVYIEVADENGAAYDWTGSTFEMRIGSTRGTGSPAVTLTQADGDVVPSIVAGKSRLTFRFRPEKLGDLAAGTHQHDLIRTLAGRPTSFGIGMIALRKGVVA